MNVLDHPQDGQPGSERRFLTIVFVDLVDYTGLSTTLDPEQLGAIQAAYQQIALECTERFGGYVAKFIGDGILAWFGYPQAHERDAERAIRASLELLHRLGEVSSIAREKQLPKLSARVGVHSGMVLVAPEVVSAGLKIPGIVGEAANIASRLQAEAPAGGIAISGDTYALVDGLFDCEFAGARSLRGLPEPVPVYLVKPGAPVARRKRSGELRGAALLAGRDAALGSLLRYWEVANAGSKCVCVSVQAEAGVGKTRLVSELCRRPEFAQATVFQALGHELYSQTPLSAIGTMLWGACGLATADLEAEREEKVRRLLADASVDDQPHRNAVMSAMGFEESSETVSTTRSPAMLRRTQADSIVSLFVHLADRRPTVFWIEDAHWLDPSSGEILQDLVAAITSPSLMILTMRPFPSALQLPAFEHVLSVVPLEQRYGLELAKSIPGADALATEVLEQAIRSAEGVPLFIEQLVLSLLDEGTAPTPRDRWLGGLPLTLAEMLSARLDRLPGGRRIAQAAACIERPFDRALLGDILGTSESSLNDPLDELVGADILVRVGAGSDARYEFYHALLCRMAYESTTRADRRVIHGRIADQLLHGGTAQGPHEVLAHHLTEAGRRHEAIEAWLKAGRAAAARSANVEAISHLRRGLDLIHAIDDASTRRKLELDLQVTMMGSLLAVRSASAPELNECCERGIALCGQEPPTPHYFPFAFGQFTHVNWRGRSREAETLARRFLERSDSLGFTSGTVIGHRMLGMALMTQGQVRAAREEIEASLRAYVPERDAVTIQMFGQDTEIHSRSLLSFTKFFEGDIDDALTIGAHVLHMADEMRHPHSSAIPLVYVGGWVFGMCGAHEPMLHSANRLIHIADTYKLAGFRAHGMAHLGWALCQRGELLEGVAVIEQAIEAFDAVQCQLTLAGHLANLADGRRRLGRLREARAASARALAEMTEGSLWLEPEIRRIAALVEDSDPERPGRAEAMAREAIAGAQRLGFDVMEWRCLCSLAEIVGLERLDASTKARAAALESMSTLDRRAVEAVKHSTESPQPN